MYWSAIVLFQWQTQQISAQFVNEALALGK